MEQADPIRIQNRETAFWQRINGEEEAGEAVQVMSGTGRADKGTGRILTRRQTRTLFIN